MLKNIDTSNWQTYRFDEIATSISEKVDPTNTDLEIYVGLEHLDAESIHIKRLGKPGDVKGLKLRCYPGDVIFGKRRAYQRKASIVEFDGFCSAHSLVLRANPKIIEPELFPFFLHSDLFMHRAVDISVGSLSPTINWKTLKHQEFNLPPKDQQAKIAELLWAMDDVVEKEKASYKKLEILRDSYKQKNLIKYRKSIENDLPPNYEVYKLEEVAEITGGSTPSRKVDNYWNGEIPWLTPTDVTKHKEIQLGATKEYITKDGLKNISNKIYPVGSILFCSRATIGFAIINSVPMATNQGFSNFICNSIISNYFLYFLLKHCTPELTRLAGGSTFLEISKASIRRFKIVLPNKEIMHQIEKYLLNIYNLLFEYEGKIQHSKQLQKSLINEIFAV